MRPDKRVSTPDLGTPDKINSRGKSTMTHKQPVGSITERIATIARRIEAREAQR